MGKTAKRRIIQLYSALLYNAHIRGFAEGKIFEGPSKAVCVPGLNCYSCPGAVGACPLGALQNALASMDQHIGFYVFGVLILFGVLLGRTICGFLCPFGLIEELLHKLPTPRVRKGRITRILSYTKYVILVVFVLAIPLWYGLRRNLAVPAFCKYICPSGTLEGAMGLLPENLAFLSMLGPVFTNKFVVMAAIFAACIFCYRAFCRFLCPLGAIYGLFNKLSVIGIRVDPVRCNGCGACVRTCGMDVRRPGDHECIHCGKCVDVCRQEAISLRAGRLILAGPSEMGDPKQQRDGAKQHGGYKFRIAAAAALAAVLLWSNLGYKGTAAVESDAPAGESNAPAGENNAPAGYEVGGHLEDFALTCLDGSVFRLSDYKGKAVVINLWATWCGPCVRELPYFVDFYHEHGEDAAVLAVHSGLVTEDVEAFLDDTSWDIPFAVDSEEEDFFRIVNGSQALPQTIVLNRQGEVIYNEVGAMTAERLEQLYEEAVLQPAEP